MGKKWIEIVSNKYVRRVRRTYRRGNVVAYWYPTHRRLKIRFDEYDQYIDSLYKKAELEKKKTENKNVNKLLDSLK
jgi:hypothetical protein